MASPSARNTRRTRWRTLAGRPVTSSTTSSNGRTENGFSRYVPQKSQVLFEQPYVTWTIRLSASLGGRMTAPWYLTLTMLAWAAGRRAPGAPGPAAALDLVRACALLVDGACG